MKISGNTKISAIIKANPVAIETIAAINPHFSKLRNPLLRKVLAHRVTVSQAASIGKVTLEVFLHKLNEIGFEIENIPAMNKASEISPGYYQLIEGKKVVELDVVHLLSKGIDPFHHIMEKLKDVPEGDALLLITSFKPLPLIDLLGKKGFQSATISDGADTFKTVFVKGISTSHIQLPENENTVDFENIISGKKIKEIDVTHLEMPGPITAILAALEKMAPEEVLLVHHFKVPTYLLAELEERGYMFSMHQKDEGDVKLLIYKNGG